MLRKIVVKGTKELAKNEMSAAFGGACEFACGCGYIGGNCGTADHSSQTFKESKSKSGVSVDPVPH